MRRGTNGDSIRLECGLIVTTPDDELLLEISRLEIDGASRTEPEHPPRTESRDTNPASVNLGLAEAVLAIASAGVIAKLVQTIYGLLAHKDSASVTVRTADGASFTIEKSLTPEELEELSLSLIDRLRNE